jgi:hypothetical protein
VLVPGSVREFIRCRILRPLLRQLRGGVTPRRLAWSLALGVVIGINPTVGVTTALVVMFAWVFGLNQVASQIGAHHAVTPLHLLLFIYGARLNLEVPPKSRKRSAGLKGGGQSGGSVKQRYAGGGDC